MTDIETKNKIYSLTSNATSNALKSKMNKL
jgi:hypothetical protein